MKNNFKRFVSFILKELAKRKIKKTGARVIGITGTVGKTSLKEAIAFVLQEDFKIKKTSKNLNGFFGLPLDILNQPYSSVPTTKWPVILLKCFLDLITSKEKYDYYVLELGVAEPFEMDYLVSIVKPYISTITNIYPAHIQNFPGGFKEYREQKLRLISNTDLNGFVVLPSSFNNIKEITERNNSKLLTYGEDIGSDYKILTPEVSLNGISFVFANNKGKKIKIKNETILGEEYIQSFSASCAICDVLGVNLEVIADRLEQFRLPVGRLNIVEGIKNTVILDGSYNASRYSTISGLKALKLFNQTKIACLGDMRELGDFTQVEHEKVAEYVKDIANIIVLVGPLTQKYLLPKLIELGFNKDRIFHFLSSEKAGKFLVEHINGGEAILVKGSQNTILMERLVYELMKDKDRAKELLCRQDEYWDKVRSVTP